MEVLDKFIRKIKKYYGKIQRRWLKFRLHHIHVFLFHQVSDVFDESTMYRCDWTETNQFKNNVLKLKEKYTFISLEEAHNHLKKDKIRLKNYAVMTSDDGWASLNNILPWLEEQEIPVTLFVNSKYSDGLAYREKPTERYITRAELESYKMISVGLHGLEHISAAPMKEEEFRNYVAESVKQTAVLPSYIPYWAYTYGAYSKENDDVLKSFGITPVYINNECNMEYNGCIDREILDGIIL